MGRVVKDYLIGFMLCVLFYVVGYFVGYTHGEDHATTVALHAQWEREAKEWDKRHEDRLRR